MVRRLAQVPLLVMLLLQTVQALQVGDEAIDFSAPALMTQQPMTMSDLHGQVVYLDFWASWCGPCRVSLPSLETLYQEFKAAGFAVLAVNVDTDIRDAKRFLQTRPISYPLIYDAEQRLPKLYGLKGMPTAYLIDRRGLIRHIHEGFRPGDETRLREMLKSLLAEQI